MARAGRFQSFRDLGFFFNADTIPVLIGTVGLAVLELATFPPALPISWFVNDYKFLIIVGFAALAVLPPPISRGFQHLRDREDVVRRNAEATAAIRALGKRASNFIFKLRESAAGTADNTYQNHLLSELKGYLESRPMAEGGERPDDFRVEANFYAAKVNVQSKMLERKLFTNEESSRMRTTFSNRGNDEAALLVERIWAGKYVFCPDVRDSKMASDHSISDGDDRAYRTFLTVPVFRDRKATGDTRILGMLSVNVSHIGVVHESDHNILEVYAWFFAAATEANAISQKLRMSGASISGTS